MTSMPDADARLIAAHDLARAALLEITPASSIGEPAGYQLEEDGVVSLRLHTLLAGYPGWFWTVSVAVVDDAEPTVLEVELLPGDGALLAPDWVPWAVRLAEYQAAQKALADAAEDGDTDLDDSDLDEDDELDEDDDDLGDDDDDVHPLHAGDVDGVDIDELDDDESDDDDDESDDDESDDDESDDDRDRADGEADPADDRD